MSVTLETNRDLYLFVVKLAKARERDARSLEDYLRALRGLLLARVPGEVVPIGVLAACLEEAFTAAAEPGDEGPGWDTLSSQIEDLRAMRRAGSLNNKLRYFGLDAPSGRRWYNFTPGGYLEAAAVGAFGGWEPGDEGGRILVPGPVAALDPSTGKIVSVDPAELEREVVALAELGADELDDFFACGAIYE